eukprot:Em0020g145a
MSELKCGTIPSLYRDLYELLTRSGSVGEDGSGKITKALWLVCLKTSGVSAGTLEEVWELCDPIHSGFVVRGMFYKSLALIGLVQSGKPLEEKVLDSFQGIPLPTPTLGSADELKAILVRFYRDNAPRVVSYTYEQLRDSDDVTVTLIPEKIGIVFKHVEYEVHSKRINSCVRRRFKEFEVFYDLLVSRFPYRLVPKLPNKKIGAINDAVFTEQRRQDLRRFLLLILRHPVLGKDECVTFFLTAAGQDIGTQLKEKIKPLEDEMTFNEYVEEAKELITAETEAKFENLQKQTAVMISVMTNMLTVAQNMDSRNQQLQQDMSQLADTINTLHTSPLLAHQWTSGNDGAWSKIKADIAPLVDKFIPLSSCAQKQVSSEFTEAVHLFLDLIVAYQDLAERREKVHSLYLKTVAKHQALVVAKERAEAQGKKSDPSKVLKSGEELSQMEKRDIFSLYCLDLESQLVHINLVQIPTMFQVLANVQVAGHSEFLEAWTAIKAFTDAFGKEAKSARNTATPQPSRSAGKEGSKGDLSSPFS